MYHQLHCLESLTAGAALDAPSRRAFWGGHGEGWVTDHTRNCLNYLRQTILCAADLTLEPEVVEGSGDVGQRPWCHARVPRLVRRE